MIFIGIVIDAPEVLIASFSKDRERCYRDCVSRLPGKPCHIIDIAGDTKTVRNKLRGFLTANKVPVNEHQRLIQGIMEQSLKMLEPRP